MAPVIMGDLDTVGVAQYVDRLAGERLYGDLGENGYESWAMKRGKQLEALALNWYEFATEHLLDRQPFVQHPRLPYVSSTPDAIILPKRRKVVEAKAPIFTTWAVCKRLRLVPSEYRWQYKWQLWCVGVLECDFVIWHPKPGGMIIPCSVTTDEMLQMADRAALVEERVQEAMLQISSDEPTRKTKRRAKK